jgi:LmbE family N-acetylglucosaminyl deacetylase
LGVAAETGRQLHLGLSETKFEFQADELADQVLRTILDKNIQQVISFDELGLDQNVGHITAHIAAEAAVREARFRFDRSVGFLVLSSTHDGAHQTAATPDSTHGKLAAMAEHVSQFAIDGTSSRREAYEQYVTIAGHAIESETWDRLQQVRPLIVNGETFHQL